MSAARRAEALWWRRDEPALAEAWLWPLTLASLGWRLGSALGRWAARPARAGVPVVSVGNLAVGGTGKTPVALHLCERLLARGRRPALLSRGHGRAGREPLRVHQGTPWRQAGDEPLLAARRLPGLSVHVGADRALLARAAVEQGADVLVLDDGLQHRRLARDLDVVVVDAGNPLGNGRLLPRGPLREGPGAFARLGPRGLLWFTGADGASAEDPALRALAARAAAAGLAGPVESRLALRDAQTLRGAPVFLLAGIARPERFEASVLAAGAQVRGRAFFADHHPFTPAELAGARARAAACGAARLLTTEKDAVRLPPAPSGEGPPVEVLAAAVALLAGGPALEAALDRLLAGERR